MSYLKPTTTPSDDAAAKVLNGDPSGPGEVVSCWAMRAALIAPALYVAGVRKGLVRTSLYASAGVTVFGFLYFWVKR